ncbi:hypothetical protein Y032_0414g1037 [Ancylostoma ceylanicum]|uniref:Uncharacterized protein n=1 Tax=Ancylostoma ceylanicum TaxID=53326 RepID=A0A016X1D0_9BILA|nr:hypothetical protein Y032_0414g1037 [Ancylostoma ceylanicum]
MLFKLFSKTHKHMVDAILRTLRYRCRRTSSFGTKYLNEANTVNLAIETELAVLSELEKKKDKKKRQLSSLYKLTKKESKQAVICANKKQPEVDDINDFEVDERTRKGRNLLNKKEGGPPSTIKESSESSQTLDDTESDKGE